MADGQTSAPPNLLLAHRDGDHQAFPKLVQEYRAPVFGYLVRGGVAEGDRDDVFQEIFIKIHRAAGQYQSDRPLHPWLFTIVANTVRTYHRKQRLKRLLHAEPAEQEPKDPSPTGERRLEAKEAVAWLEKALGGLPLAQREVLILASIENWKLQEIATALELPINTVKTHLRRARLRLIEGWARRSGQGTGS